MAALSAFAQKIEIESDQTVDFSKFHTFAIRDGRLNSRNPSLISELVKKRLDADIQRYLQAKGLTYVASGKSDLNVRDTLGAVRKTEVEAYRAGHAGSESSLHRRNAGHRSARSHHALVGLARDRAGVNDPRRWRELPELVQDGAADRM